ncbi:MAG: IS66 family insertion sequence element accessory protein TnpB [Stellaceae bacterium]
MLIATRPVDFRRGADGRAATVQTMLRQDPFCGTVFVFRSKRGQHSTFCIRFSIRDNRLPLAYAVRADLPGVADSARQGVDVHLYG